MKVLAAYTERFEAMRIYAPYAVQQLRHWAYYSAFKVMLDVIQKAAQAPGLGEEIGRAQILLTHFLYVMNHYAVEHIQEDDGQIIDKDLLGASFGDLRRWQDGGYKPKAPRSDRTHPARLETWKEIYAGNYSTKEGQVVTYDDVIQARMAYGIKDDSGVPYWMIWNYGSTYKTGLPGFPNYPGLHFVEAGYSALPKYLNDARRYLGSFYARLLQGRQSHPRVLFNKDWQRVYIETYGSDTLMQKVY